MTPYPYSTFKSAHNRATIVKILLVVGAIAGGLALLTESLSLAFPLPIEEQEISDNPVGIALAFFMIGLGLLEITIYFATVVCFCMWLYRVYNNLSALNPGSRLDHSPGWAVGSFFVPFVNLVVPYRAVREVWQKSGHPDETRFSAISPPAWFPIWWTFWLLAGFANNISLRLTLNDSVDPTTDAIVSIIANALSIMAALFAFIVVGEIDQRQEETSMKAKLGDLAGPPPPPANLAMSDVVAPTV